MLNSIVVVGLLRDHFFFGQKQNDIHSFKSRDYIIQHR